MDVVALNESFGHANVIDSSTARGAEMLLPVWVRLTGALGAASLNFKIVC